MQSQNSGKWESFLKFFRFAILTFHCHLQLVECVIPLLRDYLELAPRLLQLGWLKLPLPFASDFYVVYQACFCEDL